MKARATGFIFGAVLLGSGCGSGDIGGDPIGNVSGPGGKTTADGACLSDTAMYKSLTPTCQGCHITGTTAFFVSLGAFEDLLVNNPKYVVPGHPEQSYFVQLLQGTATGTYKQMPISGDSFAKLDAAGSTQVSLKAVVAWITTLSTKPKNINPDPLAPAVARLSAEEVEATLGVQLGLSMSDFFSGPGTLYYGTPGITTLGEDNYPAYGADQPYIVDGVFGNEGPTERHVMLGGAETLDTRKRDSPSAPPFADALIPMSQRWCKMAIAKQNNKLLFPYVDPSSGSATAASDIKKNIGYLALHFLGDPATDADAQDVFDSVFVPIEKDADAPTAWAGVCSIFIRHPKWTFF